MSEHELGVIGGGNMAGAVLRAVIDAGLVAADDIIVSEPRQERREQLSELGVHCVADNLSVAICPRVLLAVKPQIMSLVLSEIAGSVKTDALVISIAAGVTTDFLDAGLGGCGRVVRVMPNTPMLVGAGMSAIAAGPGAQDCDLEWTRKLFAACGRTVMVDEEMMDGVTAVSGSGPAYFFYMVEAMVAAGVAEGLPEDIALSLARQTCLGAGKLLADTGDAPADLRARVTSPGGTTARAVETMEAAGVKGKLIEAIRSAAERSRELGR